MTYLPLQELMIEFEYPHPRTKHDVVSEIKNWVGGNVEGAFDYAAKKGYIKKTGKDRLGDDLWEWADTLVLPTGSPHSDKSLTARAQSVLIHAKALQSAEKEKWITVKNNPVKLEEGKTVGESIKSHFEKLNKKKSNRDAKSEKQYTQTKSVMKNSILDLHDFDTIRDIFGEDFNPLADPFQHVLVEGIKVYDPKHKEAQIKSQELWDSFLKSKGNLKGFDKEFDKAVEKYDSRGVMKARKILADAYNDYMEEEMQKKDAPIYRFIDPEELIDILETKKLRDLYQDERDKKGIDSKKLKPKKCWTINKGHILNNHDMSIRIQAKRGDYDFKILKTNAYPRYGKTIKNGQPLSPGNLSQKEVRLEIGDGLDIADGLSIYLPDGFYKYADYYYEKKGYTKEDFQKLIEESGFTMENKNV